MNRAYSVAFILFFLNLSRAWAQDGIRGEYFVGTNFNQKVFTRIDKAIKFDWTFKRAAPGFPRSNFSVRWTGKIQAPSTGMYIFYAKVDDGIQLWINDEKVIDAWQLNDSQKYSGSIKLEAGKYYNFRVDYYNEMEAGEIDLYWQRPDKKRITYDRYSLPGDPISQNFFSSREINRLNNKVKYNTKRVNNIDNNLPKLSNLNIKSDSINVKSKKSLVKKIKYAKNDAFKLETKDDKRNMTVNDVSNNDYKLKIEPGKTFILENVQFVQSSYNLQQQSLKELDKLVQLLKSNSSWHIDIIGHTDNVGDPTRNLTLSEYRARTVANYLYSNGISNERVDVKGFGGERPISDNSNEFQRSKNRRVEVIVR